MKMMKLIYPLAFALAVTLAATGCRNHKPVGVTPHAAGRHRRADGTTAGDTLPPGDAIIRQVQRRRHSRRRAWMNLTT